MNRSSVVRDACGRVGWYRWGVVLVLVMFALGGCGGGPSLPDEAIGLVPDDWEEMVVIDVQRVLAGDAPPEYRDEFEGQWGDRVADVGVPVEEVSTIVVASMRNGSEVMIMRGSFDFEAVRGELGDAGMDEEEYRGFELWEGGQIPWSSSVAVLENGGYLVAGLGAAGTPSEVLRGLSRESGLIGYDDDSYVDDLVRRAGDGWVVVVSSAEDCGGVAVRRCEAVAWSTDTGNEYEMAVTWAYRFGDERSAGSAVDDLREMFERLDRLVVEDVSVDGSYVVAAGTIDEDDWAVAASSWPARALAATPAPAVPQPPAAAPPQSPGPTAAPVRAPAPAPAPLATPAPAPAPAPFVPPAPAPAPAPRATPTPEPAVSSITLTIAVSKVTEQYGDIEALTRVGSPSEMQMGLFDPLLVHDGLYGDAPFAADRWDLNPGTNELRLTIREGLRVNTPDAFAGQDFGDLTARDVAWNLNRQNSTLNRELPAAFDTGLGRMFGRARVPGDNAVLLPLKDNLFSLRSLGEFDVSGRGTPLRLDSKTAYDTVGAEAIRLIPVGSGPFTIGEWLPGSHGEVHAVTDHWMGPPHIGAFRVVQAPEITTRIAMLQTGEADIGSMDFRWFRELEGSGLNFITTMSDADTITLSAYWPGNLWTDLNVRTRESIEPWTSPVYAEDLPWLGCPWNDGCPYTDTDNPPGMSDMEQARLVRWALSYAIDRWGIVDELQGGSGTPIYSELMGPRFPNWSRQRYVTADKMRELHEFSVNSETLGPGTGWIEYTEYDSAAEPDYQWPWEIPTARGEAERLLDLAGFPRGPDGIRFRIRMNSYDCDTGAVCLGHTDAVAADWEAVGIRVELLNENLAQVVAPRMRDRTQAYPVLGNCSVETANFPLEWPLRDAVSTFSRPERGCSFESRFIDYVYTQINGGADMQWVPSLHLEMVDYHYYWQLYTGLTQLPRGVMVNPRTVDSWRTRSTGVHVWTNPQHIVPTGR